MAKYKEYQEKNKPILSILYVIAVIVLVVAMAFMYLNYRERRSEYNRLVIEASRTDTDLDIESRGSALALEEEDVEEPVAVPDQVNEAPALPDTPLVMDEPLNLESENTADQEPSLPDLNVDAQNSGD